MGTRVLGVVGVKVSSPYGQYFLIKCGELQTKGKKKNQEEKGGPQDPSHMSVMISAEESFLCLPNGPKNNFQGKESTLFLSSHKLLSRQLL